MYGPCCFELDFSSVLEAYQKCRKGNLCYKAGGTLLYKREVTHVVIICCEEDEVYQSYPTIQANSSKYFTPSLQITDSGDEPPSNKKSKLEVDSPSSKTSPFHMTRAGTLVYHNLPQGFSCPPLASRHYNLDDGRHENITFAFYLPDGKEIQVPCIDGNICENDHQGLCLKSKPSTSCQVITQNEDLQWFICVKYDFMYT